MGLIKRIKDKVNEYAIKAYVRFTVLMWEIEWRTEDVVKDLKGIVNIRK